VFAVTVVLAWRKVLALPDRDITRLFIATVGGAVGLALLGAWLQDHDPSSSDRQQPASLQSAAAPLSLATRGRVCCWRSGSRWCRRRGAGGRDPSAQEGPRRQVEAVPKQQGGRGTMRRGMCRYSISGNDIGAAVCGTTGPKGQALFETAAAVRPALSRTVEHYEVRPSRPGGASGSAM
jgi:hypothetical protein